MGQHVVHLYLAHLGEGRAKVAKEFGSDVARVQRFPNGYEAARLYPREVELWRMCNLAM